MVATHSPRQRRLWGWIALIALGLWLWPASISHAQPPGSPPLDPSPFPSGPRAGSSSSGGVLGNLVDSLPVPPSLIPRNMGAGGMPGLPRRYGRPIPGSIFDPGASGPGIGNTGRERFLGGALDPETGWPYVWLDHFRPKPERVRNLWVVHTRECPQEMGTDPWPRLKVMHFDQHGELEERTPAELFAQAAGHPVLIQVQGSLTTPDIALGGLLWTHSWLTRSNVLPPDLVLIAFDWPSQRVYRLDVADINEKGRRAYVAGYHLARFVQAFPPQSRICIVGQSYGGRVVPSALHLLGGGELNSQDHDPYVHLPSLRCDLQIRAVVLGAASDHNWLDPGQRLDRALYGCEAFLNLYNRRDEALYMYPLLVRSGHRNALGRVGLSNRDLASLGPLAARYSEHDVHDILGLEHTLLDAVASPEIARRLAPYLFAPDPGPVPPLPVTAPPPHVVRGLGLRLWE
jgi:hypothetical protein